jgi:hypothetical protein
MLNKDATKEVIPEYKRSSERLTMPVFVLGCSQRPSLLVPYLFDQTYTLVCNTDENPPEGVVMQPQYARSSPLATNWRVGVGHQKMAELFLRTNEPVGLMFEDDAVPNFAKWTSTVNLIASHIDPRRDQVLWLHGREFNRSHYSVSATFDGFDVLYLKAGCGGRESDCGGIKHVFGCLAYLMTRTAAHKMVSLPWEGLPPDVTLADRFEFAFLNPSPFDHNRSQGSLIFPGSVPKP